MRFGLGLMAVVLIGGCTSSAPTRVSVRDAHFDLVKELPPSELSEFQRQWENKQVVETPPSDLGGEHYKVDVGHRGGGGRWLYYTTGHVQSLSHHVTPVYKLSDPEAFNKLIGAHKEVAEESVAPEVRRDGLE
jgi:hypothetical protein